MAKQAGSETTRAGPSNFLNCNDPHETICRNTTVLLRKANPKQADLSCLNVQRSRKLPCVIPGARVRFDLSFDETTYSRTKSFVSRCIKRGNQLSILTAAMQAALVAHAPRVPVRRTG